MGTSVVALRGFLGGVPDVPAERPSAGPAPAREWRSCRHPRLCAAVLLVVEMQALLLDLRLAARLISLQQPPPPLYRTESGRGRSSW